MACNDNMACENAQCACLDGFYDCDGNAANGCESDAECDCTPGETQKCYTHLTGQPDLEPCTNGVCACKFGVQTCLPNATWGRCTGDVGPIFIPKEGETLDLSLDNNCDGVIDALEDNDGDGYTRGEGDCCDSIETCNVKSIKCPDGQSCEVGNPALIHPGAWDDPNNGIDDNCDGILDDNSGTPAAAYKTCSDTAYAFKANSQLNHSDALRLAQAMDVCEGLISAELLLADGSPLPQTGNKTICGSKTTLISPAEQIRVATSLGNIVYPIKLDGVDNKTMAVLSSGKAAGKENTGTDDCSGSEVKVPKTFLDAHNGVLPSSSKCNKNRNDTQANDSVMLRLKLKAPANAKGFSFQFKFFSKEYPDDVCGDFNDFFLALVNSPSNANIPKDHNVAFDANHDPVSVNNAFFTECDASACPADKQCDCKGGTKLLSGYYKDVRKSGATEWLKTSVPVEPNEEFTLDLIIFDAGEKTTQTNSGYGHKKDSLVLLDAFAWSAQSTELVTKPAVN